MYDFYGIYASCRDAAWRYLIDFDVTELPVKLVSAANRAGIRVIRNSKVNELYDGERGASIYMPDKQWLIVYDDTLPIAEARMVVAHELGHILLGHEYKYGSSRFTSGKSKLKSEREADMFAVRILAPACILHETKTLDSDRIADACMIPKNIATARAKRMTVLEGRNMFYRSELERKVRDKFKGYIEISNNKK